MCFSFKVSVGTFAFSWLTALYLLFGKRLSETQKHNIIFLMIFSSMQFADAILWKTGMKKNNINYFVTSFLIPFILSLQIVYNLFVINKLNGPLVYLLGFSAICITFGYFFNTYTSHSNNTFHSPIWGSKELSFVSMFIFFMLIFYGRIGFYGEKFETLLLITISLLFPFIFTGGFGSLWCSFANIFALYYLLKYR